jgi:iduronate 2-sulfatase
MKITPTCLLSLGLLMAAGEADGSGVNKPNVLFISIDDLRPALGAYGDPLAISPHIDALAASGRRFDRAYTQQAVCGPSRASLLTGKLPDNIRVWHNRNHFRESRPDLVTLPQWFMQQGYHAISLGKTYSGNPREEDPASWSEPAILRAADWHMYAQDAQQRVTGKGLAYESPDLPDQAYADGMMTDMALRRLREFKAKSQPFFMAVGFFKPHLPFNAPKKYWDMHEPAKFAPGPDWALVEGAPAEAYHEHRELGGYVGMPADERLTPEQATVLRHGYYACVTYIDAQVGRLMAELQATGLLDDTIVILWGDHGFALGENQRWCKGTNFEADARVPLIIRAPGMAAPGVATAALVELVDIYPTLTELIAQEVPAGLDGRSQIAVLRDPAAPGREFALSQFARPFTRPDPEVMGYSLRTAGQRYTQWREYATGVVLSEEFYDYSDQQSVEEDGPYEWERRNMIASASYQDDISAMRTTLAATLRERTEAGPAKAGKKPERR